MNPGLQLKLCAWILALFTILPPYSIAWNIPTHMLSGAMTYQILRQEQAPRLVAMRRILEHHPWHQKRWRGQVEKLPEAQPDEMLFMLAARWADDIRTQDREQQHRGPWHYINWPFKPDGEPTSVQTSPPQVENILTAIAANERIARSSTDATKRATALAWLFHLVGDIHQPLHTAQLFTREYPLGDRGGNDMCVRVRPDSTPLDLHRLWDGLLTSTSKVRRLQNMAKDLCSKFPKSGLTELANAQPEAWAKKSYEIAIKIAYQNGTLRGTPKGQRKDCREVLDAVVLPAGYAANARLIADRRIALAGHRLASLLDGIARR